MSFVSFHWLSEGTTREGSHRYSSNVAEANIVRVLLSVVHCSHRADDVYFTYVCSFFFTRDLLVLSRHISIQTTCPARRKGKEHEDRQDGVPTRGHATLALPMNYSGSLYRLQTSGTMGNSYHISKQCKNPWVCRNRSKWTRYNKSRLREWDLYGLFPIQATTHYISPDVA